MLCQIMAPTSTEPLQPPYPVVCCCGAAFTTASSTRILDDEPCAARPGCHVQALASMLAWLAVFLITGANWSVDLLAAATHVSTTLVAWGVEREWEPIMNSLMLPFSAFNGVTDLQHIWNAVCQSQAQPVLFRNALCQSSRVESS